MIGTGRVGPQVNGDGAESIIRTGRTGETNVGDAHGRFFEASSRGVLFSAGMTTTSLAAATFTTATLDATATPIAGVWNPTGSGKNLVILQARLSAILTALQATGAGTFMWATSTGNGAITTGTTPLNRLTLTASGSVAKGVAGVALTGLTTSLVVREAAGLTGGSNYNASLLATAASFMHPPASYIDHIDGAFIVPPGGVLALLCTTTPVAVSAASAMLWEEVAV